MFDKRKRKQKLKEENWSKLPDKDKLDYLYHETYKKDHVIYFGTTGFMIAIMIALLLTSSLALVNSNAIDLINGEITEEEMKEKNYSLLDHSFFWSNFLTGVFIGLIVIHFISIWYDSKKQKEIKEKWGYI